VPDPLNLHVTPGGPGELNHYFYMPGAGPTPLASRRRGVPHGQMTRHVLGTEGLGIGKRRGVALYRPPTDEPCPLLVVLDGRDYARRARLPDILDNLIAGRRIRPVAMAMVDAAGPARMTEYACSETAVIWILDHVLPLARRELSLIDVEQVPGAHGVCGASMGGLMALYTALRAPQVFGRVLSQSGTFRFGDYGMVVFDLIRGRPARPIRAWLDVGRYEELLPANRALYALLAETGYDTGYREFSAGHNFAAWRDDVWRGLEWLYGTERSR
jgi:enterochelin esterase family protein